MWWGAMTTILRRVSRMQVDGRRMRGGKLKIEGMQGINHCAAECMTKGTHSIKLYILLDNQAPVKALNSYSLESKSSWNCWQSLKQLAADNKVTLVWITGHEAIESNGSVDSQRRRKQTWLTGPEPGCELIKSCNAVKVDEREQEAKIAHWKNIPDSSRILQERVKNGEQSSNRTWPFKISF